MWFAVEAQDLGFTKSSPYVLENEAIISASPDRVFEAFATAENQTTWFQDFVACRWTSSAPHGVGSEREIELKLLTVRERFLVWEPGKRLTFALYGSTLPLVDGMIEDMLFEPQGEGKTRFTWRVHYTPKLLMRPAHPILRLVFGRMFKVSTKGVATYLAKHPFRA
ncbi:MAG: SRPBCC family protein [Byssovorax sp.]